MSFVLGILFGILLAKTGRRRNIMAESILNAVTAIPPVAYLIIFIGIWGNSIPTMLVALTASLILRMIKLVKTLIEVEYDKAYIMCAIACGASKVRIMLVHILPNIIRDIVQFICLSCAEMIIAISGFSFIGLSLGDDVIDWGVYAFRCKGFSRDTSPVTSLPDPLYFYQLPLLQLLGEAFRKGGSMMLEIKNLTVKVKNNAPILRGVSLSIDEGTCIGLTGASGSGKTTLIKSIMGMNGGDLEVPQGKILLDGDDLLKRSAKERRGLCGKTIGFIPQNPMTAFFPHAKMDRQIIETLRMHTGTDKKQARELAENVLRQVNLTDTKRVLQAYPGELSGGMLQRIAMALILGTNPNMYWQMNRPAPLTKQIAGLVVGTLAEYQKNAAILFISHDTEAMKALCSITHVMEHGEIIETQPTEQLFINPQQPWTKRFAEAACHREEVNWKWTALN